MGCLYKLTSPSGKSYIGISSKGLEARWAKHIEHALGKRESGVLYAALRKYGPENFTREVLAEEDNWKKLCKMEKAAIRSHGTFAPGGYNVTLGGEGTVGPRSEEVKKIISAAQKKRFARPEERARMVEYSRRAREVQRQKRAANPPAPKPPKPKLSKAEHSARVRAALARPEVREKVLRCARERAASPTWRKRISEGKKGKEQPPRTPEWNRRISEARKREWADPVMRAKRLVILAAARAAKKKKKRMRHE